MTTQPYSLHEGLDYIVILGPGHDTTDNPIAKIVDAKLGRAIVEWLNYTVAGKPPSPVLLLPEGLRWETVTVLDSVARERLHQDAKWGGPSHDDGHWPRQWTSLIEARTHVVAEAAAPEHGLWLAAEQRERLLLEIAALACAAIESSRRLAIPPLPADVEPSASGSDPQ